MDKDDSLSEEEYVQNALPPNALPTWLLIIVAIGIFALVGIGTNWLSQYREMVVKENAFLRVTNREMSLFLWEHPHFLRRYASQKTGYLPGFGLKGVSPKLETIEDIVAVPPELLFRFHTWNRLLLSYRFPRQVEVESFLLFLTNQPEWHPDFWREAPEQYRLFVEKLRETPKFSSQVLPLAVARAFIGWQNYYMEGEVVNIFSPTETERMLFLQKYPHYAPWYWRQIDPVDQENLPAFFRVAIYNFAKEKQEEVGYTP